MAHHTDSRLNEWINGNYYANVSDLVLWGTTADHEDAIEQNLFPFEDIIPPNPADALQEKMTLHLDNFKSFATDFLQFVLQFPIMRGRMDIILGINRAIFIGTGILAAYINAPCRCRGAIVSTVYDVYSVIRWALKRHPEQHLREADDKYYGHADLFMSMMGSILFEKDKGLADSVLFCRILWHCGLPVREKYCWITHESPHSDKSRICGHFVRDIFK